MRGHPAFLLALCIACCSCQGPYKRLHQDALAETDCDASRLMLDKPVFLEPSEKVNVAAFCWSAPLTMMGPGPGMPEIHVTAWAKYSCPSHEDMNTVLGYLFTRCRVTARGLGDPESDPAYTQ